MNIGLHPVSKEQKVNNDFLREGVKGVKCLQSCSLAELIGAGALNTDQIEAIAAVQRIALTANQAFGSVELYANGAINVFLKNPHTKQVEGYARIR